MNPFTWFQKRTSHSPWADQSMLAVRTAAADAQRSKLPQMAAALSFRTVFGLIPIAVVALLLVGHFMTPEDQQVAIQRAMEYTGLSSIEVVDRQSHTPSPTPAPASNPEAMGPEIPPEIVAMLQSGSRGLGDYLSGLIGKAGSGMSFKAIGIVGLATLVYAAISMLVEIERAFNQVYRVPRGRSWVRRVVNYWTLLTLGGIGLVLTFYIGTKFQVWAQSIVEAQGWHRSGAWTVHIIGYTVTVAISTLMLTIVYATVPNTRVRPAAAAAGGLMGALLWEAGKWGFGQYIAYSTGYAKLYGSLGLVPLFLLWVYYTWLIILFGLTVTYQFQHGRTKTQAVPLLETGPAIVEASSCLLVMVAMARAMGTGTPLSVRTLAISTGLSEPVVSLVVSRFVERGLLLRVERDGENVDPTYSLARNPGSIRVAEVLALGFELAGGPEANPVVERLHKAQIDAAGSETLADAAGLPGERPARPAPTPIVASKSLPNPAAPDASNGSPTPRPATLS